MPNRIWNRKATGTRPQGRGVAVAAGLVLLAGGGGHLLAQDGERFVQAPEATVGDALHGELTSSSPVNFNNGARHSPHWLCPAGADDGVTAYMLDAPFDAVLSAYDAEGRFLGSVGNEEDAPLSLLVGADQEGCSLVVVNGSSAKAFGPYRLMAHSPVASEPLSLDAPSVGLLDEDGKASHSLSLEQAGRVDLSMASRGGVSLVLRGEGREARADACVDGEQHLQAFLEPGDYRVELASTPGRMVSGADVCGTSTLALGGAYRLVAGVDDLSTGMRSSGPLRGGDSITGVLENGESNRYSLELDEPANIAIAVSSGQFDTVLSINGEGVSLSNDDGGTSTDSLLETTLMPGSYRVEVAGYGAGEGDYHLDVRRTAFDDAFANEGELALGDGLKGMLSGNGSNRYSLSLEDTTDISVALDSSHFDAVLRLHGNGIDISDDDSGGNLNARLSAVLEPGDYTLEAQSYSGNGIYDLTVAGEAFEGELRNSGGLALGESLNGMLNGGESNHYSLSLEEPTDVSVALDSSSFDAVLRLHGNGVDISDDDSGDNLNARLSAVLEPGDYTLEAQSYSGNGIYDLAVAGEAFEGELRNGGELRVDEAVIGSMQSGSPLHYELVVDEAATVTVEATSPTIDTMLGLSGNGIDVENDDAEGLGYGSRISQRLEAGRYDVSVSAWGQGSGTVRLEARR
uniref:hypothetical protein n=1 Tax=uncultured Halomonas sp. TaxID=173971 RepID=UPI0026366CA7|nr:hypothetical protein [uncultured Halomonas sp.]